MSAPVLIHEWDKNAREVVRVSVETFNGKRIVNCRVWYKPDDGSGLRPGKSGLAMSVAHLPQLRFAMDKAVREVFGEAPIPSEQGRADG